MFGDQRQEAKNMSLKKVIKIFISSTKTGNGIISK